MAGQVAGEKGLGFWQDKTPCWEMCHCPASIKETCPAPKYTDYPCWEIEGTYLKLSDDGSRGDDTSICQVCRVYKKCGDGKPIQLRLLGKGIDSHLRDLRRKAETNGETGKRTQALRKPGLSLFAGPGERKEGNMDISKRQFLKGSAAAVSALALTALAKPSRASAQAEDFQGNPDRFGMLTDTTKCIGCRLCETACNEAHGLPPPDAPPMDQAVFATERRPSTKQWTVVNKFQVEGAEGPVYRKAQCMHCNEPACVSVCPVAALDKTPEGAVIYNEGLCIGCRYCMAACPYTMLAYSYDSATTPAIRKCLMCRERLVQGAAPACASVCPTKATIVGKRSDLVDIAHQRIAAEPGKYVNHVFGETEAGGGSWLYLAAVPFEKLALPTGLGTTPLPELSRDWLLGVPLVITIWPALLMGVRYLTNHRNGNDDGKTADKKAEVTK